MFLTIRDNGNRLICINTDHISNIQFYSGGLATLFLVGALNPINLLESEGLKILEKIGSKDVNHQASVSVI